MTWTCPVAGCSPFWCSHWESGPLTETEFRHAMQLASGIPDLGGPELWSDWKWLELRASLNSKRTPDTSMHLEFAS